MLPEIHASDGRKHRFPTSIARSSPEMRTSSPNSVAHSSHAVKSTFPPPVAPATHEKYIRPFGAFFNKVYPSFRLGGGFSCVANLVNFDNRQLEPRLKWPRKRNWEDFTFEEAQYMLQSFLCHPKPWNGGPSKSFQATPALFNPTVTVPKETSHSVTLDQNHVGSKLDAGKTAPSLASQLQAAFAEQGILESDVSPTATMPKDTSHPTSLNQTHVGGKVGASRTNPDLAKQPQAVLARQGILEPRPSTGVTMPKDIPYPKSLNLEPRPNPTIIITEDTPHDAPLEPESRSSLTATIPKDTLHTTALHQTHVRGNPDASKRVWLANFLTSSV